MREQRRFPRLHTYDINRIMHRIRMADALTPKAYKRLHSYILSLEKEILHSEMIQEEMPAEETVYLN
ncbi:MAG: hypothetical protein EHM28_00345 [Spirochaetaceae bacterium]|nr:MAG: hypothetical protein EHM28_00345 [Spirochaetaceae bacterium]